MASIYMYVDETGNLDYAPGSKTGATPYFGFGTATFIGNHSVALWRGLRLRMRFEREGIRLPRGFHAKNDAWRTRGRVIDEIARQQPRFDFTLLAKSKAYPEVRGAGPMRLYKLAWYLHFKETARRVAQPGDHLRVIVASFGTKERATQAREALDDVCEQVDRRISLCVWDASTAWGLQVADYGLWARQRHLIHGLPEYEDLEPLVQSDFRPWGDA